ncbi:MAG: serine hydrolase domain-containing protein, partial [Desulfovibrionaceae bacterium]
LGKTDANGAFSFAPPANCAYPLALTFSGGSLRGSGASYQGEVRTIIRNANCTQASASTLSTLVAELYDKLPMPAADKLQRLDNATSLVGGLLQDFGAIDFLTTSPTASSSSTMRSSQRLRYANNLLVDLLANHFAKDVRGAAADTSSASFSALVRSVALDLTDEQWDGAATATGDAEAEAWLADAANMGGVQAKVRGYAPATTWASVAALMADEPQAGGLSLNSTQPSNPVAAPKVQPAANEFTDEFKNALRDKFAEVVADYNLIGGVIAIKRPSGALARNATGMREANSIANTDPTTWTAAAAMTEAQDQRFRIASVSKTFTATMILSLVNNGVLALDQTISHWLGNVVPEAGTITLRMLLQQTTGLYNRNIMPCALADDNVYSFQDLIDLSNEASGWTTEFTPGSKHEYADINFILLAWIAETATGKTYKELIGEHCITPASLGHTSVPAPNDTAMPTPLIHGYDVCEPSYCDLCWKDFSTYNMSWDVGSGNLISTAWDLLAWLEKLDSGDLIGSNLSGQMRTVHDVNYAGMVNGLRYYYAMGVDVFRDKFQQTVQFGHSGYDPGYSTYMYKYRGYYMVILLNIANGMHLDDVAVPPGADWKVYTAMEDWLAK